MGGSQGTMTREQPGSGQMRGHDLRALKRRGAAPKAPRWAARAGAQLPAARKAQQPMRSGNTHLDVQASSNRFEQLVHVGKRSNAGAAAPRQPPSTAADRPPCILGRPWAPLQPAFSISKGDRWLGFGPPKPDACTARLTPTRAASPARLAAAPPRCPPPAAHCTATQSAAAQTP